MLFDVYGTLLVRAADEGSHPRRKQRGLEALVKRHGLRVRASALATMLNDAIAREHSGSKARGNPHPEVVIERIWAGLFPELALSVIRRAIVEYELAVHPSWPMPGCRRVLLFLARRGITLGIVSNAQFYTPLFLSALTGAGLEDLGFSPPLCLYSFDFGAAKPDRSLFEAAVERLRDIGVTAKEAVMVGNDFANDIAPSALAGFMTVHAPLDRRSGAPALRGPVRPGPDAVIRRLASLETLIEEAP